MLRQVSRCMTCLMGQLLRQQEHLIALRCEISEYFYVLFKDQNSFLDAKCIVFVNIFTILASPDIRQRPSGLLTVIVWALME